MINLYSDTDIDIDVADRDALISGLDVVNASMQVDGKLRKHNTGVYFQNIPALPYDNVAIFDHKEAQSVGYFKLDLLNLHIYEYVKDNDHLDKLCKEPEWELFMYEEFVSNLLHLNNYTELTARMKPTSIDELAMLLAIIRPAKVHLQGKTWEEISKTVWDTPENGSYYFKRSHSYSYAMAVMVHMNILVEQVESGKSIYDEFLNEQSN